MRISSLVKFSVLGALMFTPAMADDIENVHEQALKVLRGLENQPAPAAPVESPVAGRSNADFKAFQESAAKARDEREARLKAIAAEQQQLRETRNAQRQKEYESWVRERERLQEKQREYDESVMKQSGILAPSITAGALSGSDSSNRMMAQATDSVTETHSKALEVLRSQMAGQANGARTSTPATPAAAETATPEPSPETRERVRQILNDTQSSAANPAPEVTAAPRSDDAYLKELENRARQILQEKSAAGQVTPPPVTSPAPAQAAVPPAATAPATSNVQHSAPQQNNSDIVSIHEQALQVLRGQSGAAPATGVVPASSTSMTSHGAPSVDAKSREILDRQDQQLARESGQPMVSQPSVRPTARPVYPRRGALSPEDEDRARQLLHAAQGLPDTSASANVPSTQAPVVTPSTPAPVTAAPAAVQPQAPAIVQPQAPAVSQPPTTAIFPAPPQSTSDAQYSKELEERARQILLQRSQEQTATSTTAPAPETPSVAPNTGNAQTTAPAVSAPHKTKRQKLQELNDLYFSDKMGPAEYHEKRAKILAEPE